MTTAATPPTGTEPVRTVYRVEPCRPFNLLTRPPVPRPRSLRLLLIAVTAIAVMMAGVAAPAMAADGDAAEPDHPIKIGVEPAMGEPASYYRFQVARLYLAYFNRLPDDAGWLTWNTRFAVGGQDLADISERFATSPEFVDRYGALDNRAFVGLVYTNVLGRKPERAGWNTWTSRLDQGLDRGALMVRFSESPEFTDGRAARKLLGARSWPGSVDAAYRAAFADSMGVNCHRAYSGCIRPGPDDVDCAGGGGDGPRYVTGPIRVSEPDPYGLDRDGDGVACEPPDR